MAPNLSDLIMTDPVIVTPAKVTSRIANGTQHVRIEMHDPPPRQPFRIEIPEKDRPQLKAGKTLVIETRWAYGHEMRPVGIDADGPLTAVPMSWEADAADQTPILAQADG